MSYGMTLKEYNIDNHFPNVFQDAPAHLDAEENKVNA